MSTNHTPNYSLSLWEASDQVIRTEFNENHAKIDAALAGLLGKPEIIYEDKSSSGTTSSSSIGIAAAGWNNYEFVAAYANFPETAATVQMEHSLSGYSGVMDPHILAVTPCHSTFILLWPHHDSTRSIQGILLCKEAIPFHFDMPFGNLNYYTLRPYDKNTSIPRPNFAILGVK